VKSALRAEVEDFITDESRLLDAERWADWNALFTADGVYWMPATPGQADARQMVSLIHDTPLLREVRIRRFADPNAFSLQPRPRTLRLVANVRIDAISDTRIEASGRLIATQHRRSETVHFHAAVSWQLVRSEEGLKIACKRVELVDCDAPQGDIHHYL
jgi:benzoate/toluate 1,2-dioxygenase beta subunit